MKMAMVHHPHDAREIFYVLVEGLLSEATSLRMYPDEHKGRNTLLTKRSLPPSASSAFRLSLTPSQCRCQSSKMRFLFRSIFKISTFPSFRDTLWFSRTETTGFRENHPSLPAKGCYLWYLGCGPRLMAPMSLGSVRLDGLYQFHFR